LLTARNILTDTERPLGNSILQSGASFGAVLTPLVIEVIRAAGAQWQAPFVVIGVIGLIWVPVWMILVRGGSLKYVPPKTRTTDLASAQPIVLAQLAILTVIVVTISLAWQFQRAWLPKYLKEYHHYSESTANYFTSGYYVVAGFGSLAFGSVVSVLTRFGMHVRVARFITFGGCAALVALGAVVPQMEPGRWLLAALVLMGAGSLGAHPQYYALVQELPAKYMGFLSGVLAATSWVAVGRMQGIMGDHIKQTGSYDLPLVVTGLAPLAGLLAMGVWVMLASRIARGPLLAERDQA
jgi:ACS family hexuronate transporter-like MFS transporter